MNMLAVAIIKGLCEIDCPDRIKQSGTLHECSLSLIKNSSIYILYASQVIQTYKNKGSISQSRVILRASY